MRREALVIEFAVAGSSDGVDADHPLRRLVRGQVEFDVSDEFGLVDRRAGERFDERGDRLSEPLVGYADDCRIGDGRVQFERLFDFLGVDLFATRVDALAASAEKVDGAVDVDARPVAGNRPSSSLPGVTSRPSSVSTRVFGPSWKRAVSAGPADDVVL